MIGEFTLPLVEGLTPCVQSSDGSYVFPDVTSPDDGAAVGIKLADRTSTDTVDTFQALLVSLTAPPSSAEDMRTPAAAVTSQPAAQPASMSQYDATQSPAQPANTLHSDTTQPPTYMPTSYSSVEAEESKMADSRMSTQISKGLVTAAEWVSWGLEKGAEKVGVALAYGGEKLRRNLRPSSQERQLDDRHRKCLSVARIGTSVTLQVSSAIVRTLGDATMALGKKVTPHIKTQAKKLLPNNVTKPLTTTDETGRSKADDIIEVAGAGVKGFGVVYLSLEEAAKALGRCLASQTRDTVSHKYGQQYGEAAENALYTAGNTALAAHNITQLGPKAIAKKAAKDTAKAVITTPREKPPDGAAN
ncbi:SPG20 [Bugula neritina]|uniref:SPG20 n=1 Tax=Bugula neritina TaxID=10212 RepID=A0A7J7JM09_BUGNE|nr:SPG20 [Bugula neritina]